MMRKTNLSSIVLSRETEIINHWLKYNDKLYRYSRKLAQNAKTASELATQLKGFFENNAPEENSGGIFGDLLRCALDKVNWEQIAEDLIVEIRGIAV